MLALSSICVCARVCLDMHTICISVWMRGCAPVCLCVRVRLCVSVCRPVALCVFTRECNLNCIKIDWIHATHSCCCALIVCVCVCVCTPARRSQDVYCVLALCSVKWSVAFIIINKHLRSRTFFNALQAKKIRNGKFRTRNSRLENEIE